jgi:hypothetical protein
MLVEYIRIIKSGRHYIQQINDRQLLNIKIYVITHWPRPLLVHISMTIYRSNYTTD